MKTGTETFKWGAHDHSWEVVELGLKPGHVVQEPTLKTIKPSHSHFAAYN